MTERKDKNPYIESIIQAKAEIDAKDNNGNTALHLAVACKNNHAIQLLLDNKADVNATNNKGKTPLSCAKSEQQEKIQETLVKYGAVDSIWSQRWQILSTKYKKHKTYLFAAGFAIAGLYAAYNGWLPQMPSITSLWAKIPWYNRS